MDTKVVDFLKDLTIGDLLGTGICILIFLFVLALLAWPRFLTRENKIIRR